jgi:hypothetical protein
MRDSFRFLTDAEWKKTRQGPGRDLPGVFWEYTISPPIPSFWPPDEDRRVSYYLYATGHDPCQLADGCRIAAPWGLIRTTGAAGSAPEFVRISENIREIGIQGVRPVSSGEALIFLNQEAAETFLETLAVLPGESQAGARLIREYYCLWCGHNGVIAEELRTLHGQFFSWLGCR